MPFKEGLSSLEELATTKVAVVICNHPDVKKEIFCVPGSKLYCSPYNRAVSEITSAKQWYEFIADRAQKIIENFGLPQQLQIKVASMIIPIAFRMLDWKSFHVDKLRVSCSAYLVELLNSSLFTSRGLIDKKKAAEIMVRDERLDVTTRFKLACVYILEEKECLVEDAKLCSDDLWEKIPIDKKDNFRFEPFEPLLKFWLDQYYYHKEYVVKDQSFWLEAIEAAIADASIVAVSYCWQKLDIQNREKFLIDGTMYVLRICSLEIKIFGWINQIGSKILPDYIVDILCFFLREMTEDQLNKFFRKGYSEYEEEFHLLNYLIHWPYQVYFIEAAQILREVFPLESYVGVLKGVISSIKLNIVAATSLLMNEQDILDMHSVLQIYRRNVPNKLSVDNVVEKLLLGFFSRGVGMGKVELILDEEESEFMFFTPGRDVYFESVGHGRLQTVQDRMKLWKRIIG